MAFVPPQVKAKESAQEKQTELSIFLKDYFRREKEPRVSDNSGYQPHRYILDLIHCEPPRVLLGSNERDQFAGNLFRPEPSIIRALQRRETITRKIETSVDITKPLFQHVPEFKAPAKKTFLDDTDDEEPPTNTVISTNTQQKEAPKSSLFAAEPTVQEEGGLFGFSMDLPKLSRVGRVDEDADITLKLDDSLADEDDAADEDDTEKITAARKKQKLTAADKRLDKEVESFLKRTE